MCNTGGHWHKNRFVKISLTGLQLINKSHFVTKKSAICCCICLECSKNKISLFRLGVDILQKERTKLTNQNVLFLFRPKKKVKSSQFYLPGLKLINSSIVIIAPMQLHLTVVDFLHG